MLNGKKWLRGSTVVEMAYLMPVVFFVWMLIIFALFYYHDKNIIGGAAYETAVVASELLHEDTELPEGKIERYFQERIYGKLFFFRGAAVQVISGEDRVSVKARAARRGLRIFVERSAAVTVPEERIRKIQAGKDWMDR